MSILRKISAKTATILVLVAFTSSPVTAETLSAPDINLSFGANIPSNSRNMSAAEMHETKGEWAAAVRGIAGAVGKAVGKKAAKDAAKSNGIPKERGRQQKESMRKATRVAVKIRVEKRAVRGGATKVVNLERTVRSDRKCFEIVSNEKRRNQ